PKEEHLPRLLVIDHLCLQIGLRLVGCMESQEGGAPPVVAEREAIGAAWRTPSAIEPQRIAAQGRERRVGSRVTPDPVATDCVWVELVAYLMLEVGSGFRRACDHPEASARLHHL